MEQKYATLILQDIHKQVLDGEAEWSPFLLDYITSCVVMDTNSSATTSNEIQEAHLKQNSEILRNLIEQILTDNSQSSHNVNFDILIFLILLLDPSSNIQHFVKWFRHHAKANFNNTSGFQQFNDYFLEFSPKDGTPISMLELNVEYVEELRRNFSFQDALQMIESHFNLNKDSWSKICEKRNLCDGFKPLCSAIILDKGSSIRNERKPQIVQVEICSVNMLFCFGKMLENHSPRLQSSHSDLNGESGHGLRSLIELMLSHGTEHDVNTTTAGMREDRSLTCLIWRIDKRQTGYQGQFSCTACV